MLKKFKKNKHQTLLKRSLSIILVWLSISTLSHANDNTLSRIAGTGRIVLGVSDSAIPLSYLDISGTHIGYHLDICLRLVAAIQKRYDLPQIKVVTVPTNLATRFALLDNRTIDIECGSNTVNTSSLQQALLAHATMVLEIRVMTQADNKDLSISNLGGKTIGLEAGSSAAASLRALARNGAQKVKETYARQAKDTFALLTSGRVDAVASPTPSLLAQRALSVDPSHYVLVDGVLRTDPIALMFRLQDEELQALANEVIDSMMKTGEMARLYDKWFMQPIPSLPQALGIPIPQKLRELFDAPGSEMKDI